MDVNIVNAESLVVGPDEVLIVRFPGDIGLSDESLDFINKDLQQVIGDRFFIFVGDVEFAKVQREPSPGIAADYADSAE